MNKLTTEQETFLDCFTRGKHIGLEALAGTGKTSTCIAAVEANSDMRTQFAVFNKKNAEEMTAKFREKGVTNAVGTTFHSFCNKFTKKGGRFDKDKTAHMLERDDDYAYEHLRKGNDRDAFTRAKEDFDAMVQLVKMLKNFHINPSTEDVEDVIEHFGITFCTPFDKFINDAICFLKHSDMDQSVKDYDDMIRHPLINKGFKHLDFDAFIIDEAQDNTPIRSMVGQQLKEQGIQIGYVGDKHQAIYGFAGSDCNSMQTLAQLMEPELLPLTVNFRCSQKVIVEAQKLVPTIKWHDAAPEGVVSYLDADKFLENFKPGDVALSRMNKTIIPLCFKLIKAGKKATIQGRDFGERLQGMVKSFRATDPKDLIERLNNWLEKQLANTKNEEATDDLYDRYDCMKYFADNCNTMEEIYLRIADIFNDTQIGYKFSTAHRAKGLEWDNVFILDSDKFQLLRKNMKPWQVQQERNLYYVAVTRAKKNLTYVRSKEKKTVEE